MLFVPHLRDLIITPALAAFPEAMRTDAAVELLIGTTLKESTIQASARQFLKQSYRRTGDGRGRALGIYQMEPDTYRDHVAWLNRNPDLGALIFPHGMRPATDLMGDLTLATHMARVHYWVRGKDPLPALGDIAGYAAYWGRWWQTQSIPAQMAQFEALYRQHALPTAPPPDVV